MTHTTTITTGSGIIRHNNVIATEPGFYVQILEFHDCNAPKLTLHEDGHQFILNRVHETTNFWISKWAG